MTITAEDLQRACHAVYSPWWRHAPAQIFIDSFEGYDPPTTFLRCSFPNKFSEASAVKLEMLKALLLKRHGECGNLVLCVYFRTLMPDAVARRSVEMGKR